MARRSRTCWRRSATPVHREYYVNDAGRQMDILATSVWLRYLELCGEAFEFPSNGYKGDYVWDIAATLHREHADAYRVEAAQVFAGAPADERPGLDGGDKEDHIDHSDRRRQAPARGQPVPLLFRVGAQHHPRRHPRRSGRVRCGVSGVVLRAVARRTGRGQPGGRAPARGRAGL